MQPLKQIGEKSYQGIILGNPYTKKNSPMIIKKKVSNGDKVSTRPGLIPSSNFLKYQKECALFLKPLKIDYPINIEAHFYMATRRKVDLTNLNEALHDIMVHYETIIDDNAKIVVSTDGSRVHYDKENPRTEYIITPAEPTFIV